MPSEAESASSKLCERCQMCASRPDTLETELETRLRPPSASGAQQGSSLFTHFEDVQVSTTVIPVLHTQSAPYGIVHNAV